VLEESGVGRIFSSEGPIVDFSRDS